MALNLKVCLYYFCFIRIVLHERKTWHVAGEEEDEECDEEEEDKKERMEETVSEVQNMQMTSSQ